MAKKRAKAKDAPSDGPALVEETMNIVAGKWKSSILFHLEFDGPLRFSDLKRRVTGVTQRMLTQQLRDLERHGLVSREHYPEIPPRVEYSLTELGMTLGPVFKTICHWSQKHLEAMRKSRTRYDLKHSDDQ